MAQPASKVNYQMTAIMNIKLMLEARNMKQVDLASYMGKQRQNMNRMLRGESQWMFNDMCQAANFFGVSLDMLLNPNLTVADLIGDNKKPRGGVATPRLFVKDLYRSSFVAGHGFEPWTSGL